MEDTFWREATMPSLRLKALDDEVRATCSHTSSPT
jgi:hypothetical protein